VLGFELVVTALILYSSIYRLLMWNVVTGFMNYRIPLLLEHLGFSQPQFNLNINLINSWITRFVILTVVILLLFTEWKYIRNRSFWMASLPLVVLLVITGLSRFWSVASGYTYARFQLLLAAALGGVLIGCRYKKSSLRMILEIFATLLVTGSLIMILKFPEYAILRDFRGSDQWNGIFSWKMPAGTLMGFAVVLFLFRLLDFKDLKWIKRIYSMVLYGLSWILLIKSQSSTELMAVVAVHFFIILGMLYLKCGHYLKPVHWWMLTGLVVVVVLAASFGHGFLLGLIGRDITLTGRLPLWNSLGPAIRERLFFGYGFGEAFWKNEVYYLPIWELNTWQPVFAHNGYIEALMDNGIVGLALWIIFLVQVAYLSLRYFIQQHNLPALFFFSWFAFMVVMNVGNNHLGSYETFTWLLLVISFAFVVREGIDQNKPALGSTNSPQS
jgi:exopolysaccharide production protein ExoQ